MLDPSELLALARELGGHATPRDVDLRRAISSAYYALFHATLKAGAERFIGRAENGSAAYTLLYRGFSHGRMKDICIALTRPSLGGRHGRLLGRSTVSQVAKEFAAAFLVLQERRHLADYDPQAVFRPADATASCDAADRASQALTQIDGAELTDILALLLVDSRA